jgi:hypothetical protein
VGEGGCLSRKRSKKKKKQRKGTIKKKKKKETQIREKSTIIVNEAEGDEGKKKEAKERQ